MPLLDGKAHTLSTATPLSFRPDEQVFVLQTTGEIVSDFQRYTELHKLYRCKKWASITGKTGLTFAEAAKEEEKNKSLAEKVSQHKLLTALSANRTFCLNTFALLQFPPEIVDDAIHIVHHSPFRVEELITSIQDKFNPYGKRAYEPGNKHSVSKVVVKAWLQEASCDHHPCNSHHRSHTSAMLGQPMGCTDQQLIYAGSRAARGCRWSSLVSKARCPAAIQSAN